MNLKSEKNLLFRILTASLGIPLVLGLLYFSWNSFLILCALLSLACIWEFLKITGISHSRKFMTAALLPPALAWLAFMSQPHPGKIPEWTLVFILGVILLSALVVLFDESGSQPIQTLALLVFSGVYIFLPFGLFYRLGYDPTGNYDFKIPLGILLLIWCSDTLAYVTGRLIGKRKLMPSVSPSKTMEGAIGGFVFTLGLAWYLQQVWYQGTFDWRILGLIIGIACPVGDLVESRLKRALEVKDSGGILPGHGGLLDRFDGFLLSIPALYIYLELGNRLQFIVGF